ncbi:permease for cytosine/purines, uracil, thiamine, allantoin-domain-containing protein [Phyllosticta citriasiana]|uniref:Permease for cytosine/purines, uracil, thiamine, allantoin-domain-containing protein n=1 Tax=Phyllosticta citriasiana TaxID=595635 RepID=A0ABR1KVL5_9PEZI
MLGFMFSIFETDIPHSIFLGPFVGIFITDYLVVRNGNVRVAALFDPTGVYWYRGGVSWRAAVAYVVAVMLPISGFGAEFGCSVSAGAVYPYEIGWLLTCVVSSVVCWAPCRLGSAFAMEERQLPFEALAAEQLEAKEDEPAQDVERLQVSGEVKV